VAALAAAHRTAGFTVQVLGADGRKGHLLVTFPLGGTYRVDVLKERLNHPVVWMEFGPEIGLDMAESESWLDDEDDRLDAGRVGVRRFGEMLVLRPTRFRTSS
jgi:hypothetical protein